MEGAASQAGDADSSRAPGLTLLCRGPWMSTVVLYCWCQWQCISSFVSYIVRHWLNNPCVICVIQRRWYRKKANFAKYALRAWKARTTQTGNICFLRFPILHLVFCNHFAMLLWLIYSRIVIVVLAPLVNMRTELVLVMVLCCVLSIVCDEYNFPTRRRQSGNSQFT